MLTWRHHYENGGRDRGETTAHLSRRRLVSPQPRRRLRSSPRRTGHWPRLDAHARCLPGGGVSGVPRFLCPPAGLRNPLQFQPSRGCCPVPGPPSFGFLHRGHVWPPNRETAMRALCTPRTRSLVDLGWRVWPLLYLWTSRPSGPVPARQPRWAHFSLPDFCSMRSRSLVRFAACEQLRSHCASLSIIQSCLRRRLRGR